MATSQPTSTAPEPHEQAGPTPFELDEAQQKKRMLIIVNPYASTVSDRLKHLVVYALQGRYEVDAIDTEAKGHAIELCKEAAEEGYDVVVAFGGDGTVNEVANGLLHSNTPLSCLPGGSANVFGKMLGIPGEIVEATEHLLELADQWSPRRVDVGVVDGRCFTFASGLGIDASVVKRVDSRPKLKARFGPWFFTAAAVNSFMRDYLVRPPRLTLRMGELSVDGVTAVIQNGSPFTYFADKPIEIAEGPPLDSGTLAGCVLRNATPMAMPFITWRALSKRAKVVDHRQIVGFTDATELTVRSADDGPLPLQVDGDYLGEVLEANYSILPAALRVVG